MHVPSPQAAKYLPPSVFDEKNEAEASHSSNSSDTTSNGSVPGNQAESEPVSQGPKGIGKILLLLHVLDSSHSEGYQVLPCLVMIVMMVIRGWMLPPQSWTRGGPLPLLW